jgi:hypothetical protein
VVCARARNDGDPYAVALWAGGPHLWIRFVHGMPVDADCTMEVPCAERRFSRAGGCTYSLPALEHGDTATVAHRGTVPDSLQHQWSDQLAACDSGEMRVPAVNPVVAATVTSSLPDGHQSIVPDRLYEKDTENGWTWGNHPGMSAETQAALRRTVAKHKPCFAYHMNDLVGYSGLAGPFTIKVRYR